MIPIFYAQKARKEDHDKTYVVRVWRLEDWLSPELNTVDINSIQPSVEFPCSGREDCELLVDRLNALQAVMAGAYHGITST